MPRSSPRQRKTLGRVMHEFKHGELKSGPGGRAGKVKNRRQAIAIALREAGASKYESESENRRSRAKSARKEARGETYQQEREGKIPCGGARPARKQLRHGRQERQKNDGARTQGRPGARAQERDRDQGAALPARQGAIHPGPVEAEQATARKRVALKPAPWGSALLRGGFRLGLRAALVSAPCVRKNSRSDSGANHAGCANSR